MQLEEDGQGVFAGSLKTVVFALFALILSVGHSVCAEVLASSASASTPVHESHALDAGNDHHANHKTAQKVSGEHEAPCGTGDSDCQHCNAAQFYKTASVAELASPLPASAAFFVILHDDALASISRVGAVSFQVALRRRGPPGETPVSLKTKLLN